VDREKVCFTRRTQHLYIKEKVAEGWTPDVIIGRKEMTIDPCSVRNTFIDNLKEKNNSMKLHFNEREKKA